MYTPCPPICHLLLGFSNRPAYTGAVIVGIVSVHLLMPGNRSLKDKRRVVKSLLERVRNRFNVAIAEVGHHDLHGSALLGLSCVTTDSSHAHSVLDNVLAVMSSMYPEVEFSPEVREILPL